MMKGLGNIFAIALGILPFASSHAAADNQVYGSMTYYDGMPGVVVMNGEISDGDSFEFRRAMRDHEIELVITASPGGSLYEGLQIAAIINDNGINTYIPEGVSCESSCANVFLGGAQRLVLGEIGVHQFYSGSPNSTDSAPKHVTTARTLYTTSDVIGIMNQFDTPPFVYEKMFGTEDMYYFKGVQKAQLNRGAENENFLRSLNRVDQYVSLHPKALDRPRPQKTAQGTSTPSSVRTPTPSKADEWVRLEDVDFFGMDLTPTGHRGVSVDQCDQICRSNPNCAAWSYVLRTSWCWPKSGVQNVSYAEGTVSMVVDSQRIAPGILDRPFVEATGKDLRGFDIFPKGLKNTSLQQCRNACEMSASCKAFVWVTKKNWCFPKYAVGGLTDQLGIISGIKRVD